MVTLSINWNSTDFPQDYPENAHFSKLIGWSHDTNQMLFKVGTLATAGIKNMAETGSTSPLESELDSLVELQQGLDSYIGSGLSTGTGDIELNIEVSNKFPAVTMATMIAPSPDWYIAFVNINLMENGSFVDTKTVDAHVYDSGTDDGTTYTSENAVTTPQENITLFVDSPLGDGSALNATIATVTFTKL